MTVEHLINKLKKIEDDQTIVIVLDRTTGNQYPLELVEEVEGMLGLYIDAEMDSGL